MAFALTVDTNSWTVEQLYEALGGKPIKISLDEALDFHGLDPLDDESHTPEYFVSPPSLCHLWTLCTASEPSIRLIDLSESFRLPFNPETQHLPGTPWEFAAPELLLDLPREVTLSIDIWALGCTIYSLLGDGSPIHSALRYIPYFLARILIFTGGKDFMPERFWNAFSEDPDVGYAEESIRKNLSNLLDWDWGLRPRDLAFEGDADIVPLEAEDYEVLKAVTAAALVVDPADRAPAGRILEIMREGWAVIMQRDGLDLVQLGPGTAR